MNRYRLYWGETHDNTYQAPDSEFSMEEHLGRAAAHLDFYTAAYYPSTSPAFRKGGHPTDDKRRQPLNVETWKPAEQIAREWNEVKLAVEKMNREGSFVAFPGFEWQGDGTWGDHNVIFNEADPSIVRVDTLPELYERLRSRRVLAIPHHTAYIRGFRGRNWDVHDEIISPFMEIFSIHGSSEGESFGGVMRSNPFLGPEADSGSYTQAIARGLKLGAIASTDNWGPLPGHWGRGLAGVWAQELSREGIWEAFTSRRVYGVTGDRILLWFELEGHPMGSILPVGRKGQGFRVPGFRVLADAPDRIDSIDFIRDEILVDRWSLLGADYPGSNGSIKPVPSFGRDSAGRSGIAGSLEDYGGEGSGEEFRLRFEYGWGPAEQVLPLPPKRWNGRIILQGGEIVKATPCWVSPGQKYAARDREFTFSGAVSQDSAASAAQNGYVLQIRGTRSSLMRLQIDGMEREITLGEMLGGGSVLWNREAAAGLIRSSFSVDPETLARKDVLFGMAWKVKLHQLQPASVCRREVSFSDHLYDGRPHVYRVRVRQRNGQLAWSSPIWLE